MCREGDVVALNTLLETSQPNLDHSNAKGLSALHYAARNNHAEVIQLLINHGAGRDIHFYSVISITCMLACATDETELQVKSVCETGPKILGPHLCTSI